MERTEPQEPAGAADDPSPEAKREAADAPEHPEPAAADGGALPPEPAGASAPDEASDGAPRREPAEGAGGDSSAVPDGQAGRRRRPWVRWARRTALAVTLLLVVPLLAAETALRVNYMGDP